jgi:amino acid permease
MAPLYPHELSIGDVYFAPVLAVIVLAFLASIVTVGLLNKLKLSRWFFAPSYVFMAIMLLYMVLIDHYWIKF